ncbi:MAG: ribosomal protein S18-alanine N-acetyltransferase [Sphingorhabdus sp.]
MIMVAKGDAQDIAAIMPVMNHAFDPEYGEAWTSSQCMSALAMPDCRLLIAKSDGQVAGFAISRWVLDIEELLMIGVAPEWQRQNIGSLLMTKIVSLARKEGRSKIFLEVRDGNRAHDFYLAFGFQPIGRRKQYYRGSNGFRPDAITMAISL